MVLKAILEAFHHETPDVIWNYQFATCFCFLLISGSFLIWNYRYLPSPFICSSGPYQPWVKDYLVLVCGASAGQTLLQYFRVLIATQGFSDGKLRHPQATKMVLLICTIQSLGVLCYYYELVPYTCRDFLTVKTSPFLWLEWCCTVPFMFFLISMMDVKRTSMKAVDWKVQICGGGSLFLLMSINFPLPRWLLWANFILANILMTYALLLQQFDAYDEYCLSYEEHQSAIKLESRRVSEGGGNGNEKQLRDSYDRYTIAQCKMNCCVFISLFFSVFPFFYYLKFLDIINDEVFVICTLYCSYLSKVLFSQILFDSHVEILDPNKFLLVEEKRKSEESRLMFLRYVFHEVRVPLNSVSLGIQLLLENEYLCAEDKETIHMMRDATSFMAETLNDVLSLQKIEEGMLQLEYKPFQPEALVRSVLNNFKTQYDSKHIRLVTIIDPNVPRVIVGDQFRLEHVLGNLLSNAIKFSDPDSKIEIIISFETKLKGHITYNVRDFGPGMSPEEQKLLFQPFMQIRPGELQKGRGSGLGLSICKTIVTLHNGTIGCNSKKRIEGQPESGGSEFYFNIEFQLPDHSSESSQKSASSQFSASKLEVNGRSVHGRSVGGVASLDDQQDHTDAAPVSPSTFKRKLFKDLEYLPEIANSTICTSRSSTNLSRLDAHNKSSEVEILRKGLQRANSSSAAQSAKKDEFPVFVSSEKKEDRSSTTDPRKEECETLIQGEKTDVKVVESSQINSAVDETSKKASSIVESNQKLAESQALKKTVEVAPVGSRTINRILVVDGKSSSLEGLLILNVLGIIDVLSNRKMLEMVLRRKGFSNTEQCADGQEAVDLLREKGNDYFDIIFMDYSMPIMCGPEAAREIRKLGFTKLIIGVTGNAMDVDIQAYEEAGADLILPKPLNIELVTKIFHYCDLYGSVSPDWKESSDESSAPEKLKAFVKSMK